MTDSMRSGTFTPADQAVVRSAATVVLVRDGSDGVEVFMVKRPQAVDFSDLYVFPGGKVDAHDRLGASLCDGATDVEASHALGIGDDGLAFWVAAIRECFEECGVLVARRNGAAFRPRDTAEAERFARYRRALCDGELTLAGVCERESLVLSVERLLYFSHWMTPVGPPRRYDTRFFCAVMPEGQEGLHDDRELVHSTWVRPQAALARFRGDDWKMIHPTVTTLEMISGFLDVRSLETAIRARRHLPRLTAELIRQGMRPYR